MSKCTSSQGEFSEHQLNADHVCELCGALDEEALLAELHAARRQLQYAAANTPTLPACSPVLPEIAAERARQDERWGEQNHPDGTGPRVPFAGRLCHMADAAHDARLSTKAAAGELGTPSCKPLTWRHILLEEVFEALAEDDPAKLRAELVQVAAVAAAWIEAIDRRTAAQAHVEPSTVDTREHPVPVRPKLAQGGIVTHDHAAQRQHDLATIHAFNNMIADAYIRMSAQLCREFARSLRGGAA